MAVGICGCWVLVGGAGWLFVDPTLSFGGGWARLRVVQGADVHVQVVHGHGGAVRCVLCPALTVSETSVGGVLTFDNLNNNKRRHHRRLLFDCHVTLGNVAPGNPLILLCSCGQGLFRW